MINILGIMCVSFFINNIIPGKSNKNRTINLIFSILTLYVILGELLKFNFNNNEYQERIEILGYTLGFDGIGISLIALMGVLDPILIMLIKGEREEGIERKRIINYIQIIKILIIILFAALDLFLFFITFELILIPMFLLISRYGSQYQYFLPRLEAGIRFFLYTMIGSILMFLGIIIMYIKYGTTSNELLNIKISETLLIGDTNNILILQVVWILLFFSFLIKIPMFPFHTWLPLAHSDAPTIGSIILAALLLKLASFGILRYSLYLYEPFNGSILEDSVYSIFLPIIYILALISIIYCSFIPLRGLYDFKKIIAYSSVIHMNFSIFGFFSKDLVGLIGASFLMFTHAFISSALFLLIGILYKRYHSRFLPYYQGLSITMPLFAFFFLFFSFANISLPFCASFLAEFFILVSSLHSNLFISILLVFSLIVSSAFMIWFANRLLFGTFSPYLLFSKESIGFKDLTYTEFLTLIPFFVFTFVFTFFPQSVVSILTLPVLYFI
ncbi:NADH dehydrogenase subunit 4 (mitochondrion) [Paramicrosporidium saccamoebae]|uniref:NADH-ubiquinone oxidoreductase chain 4 n=1 Tax=Paramicrosporidium saccamoebae TaxID=1246581 RepID=A0A2H9TR29_9FUNG|nr:NADH dehydrogenase subunit 4 [Paramicrosporidium saccamoebae]